MNKYNIQPDSYPDIHGLVTVCVNNKIRSVDESLGNYFEYKYGYSLDDIKSVVENTNNFKRKGFKHIVQGDTESYYDKDTLILSVVGNIIEGFTINQVWKE